MLFFNVKKQLKLQIKRWSKLRNGMHGPIGDRLLEKFDITTIRNNFYVI